MGNFSVFMGCPSADAAARDNRSGHYWDEDCLPASHDGWGPSLCSKYAVPMLWVACFSREDEILVARTLWKLEDQTSEEPNRVTGPRPHDYSFMGLWVSADVARKRVIARKHGILESIPEPLRPSYGDLIDAWADHLQSHYAHGVFLDGDDVFGMIGSDEAAEALRDLLDALARMDRGEAPLSSGSIERLSPLPQFQFLTPEQKPNEAAREWRGQFAGNAHQESIVWPPEPTADEVSFANTLPRMSYQDQLAINRSQPQKPWWKFW